ncbi:hypothetical protein [Sphingobium sp. SCG-1]|uniref:hypothetical protein n=1 Tax=Sphingobium sp. SCG-1 TaxID=2072936 RepID=UPI001670C159|nr:hypothetical protein [Sphingobium sp. SCG-1]
MVAFLKSDLFLKFFGGFVLGTVGFMTLNPAEAQQSPNDAAAAVSHVNYDAGF